MPAILCVATGNFIRLAIQIGHFSSGSRCRAGPRPHF